MLEQKQIKIAILDLYEGKENQGMRCIREIINQFSEQVDAEVVWDEFEVRLNNKLPGLDYDIYISSGGPGNPTESINDNWDKQWCNWLTNIMHHNNDIQNESKKFVFFICHSFQLASRHLQIGNVCARKSNSFGVFPIHVQAAGMQEPIFSGLADPFYAVDSRDYQVIEPNDDILQQLGASILCIEKDRPHIPLERAIMGLRFNDYMVGTQFHPEADAVGMRKHLLTEEKKKQVIEQHGLEKWESMINHLEDPDKIMLTHAHILPNFLHQSVEQLMTVEV
jgi:homoserine O-succinyltransferase/O-acetyltransferase